MTDPRQAVEHDGFDAETYHEARERFPRLAAVAAGDGPDGTPLTQAPALFQDVFLGFHQRYPALADVATMHPAYQANRGIMEELIGTPEYANLRAAGTVGDDLSSAMATVGVAHRIIAALDNEDVERMNDLARLHEKIERLLDGADTLDALATERNRPELHQRADKQRRNAAKLSKYMDKAAAELAASEEDRRDTVRRAVRAACTDAQHEIEQLDAAMQAFGAAGGGGSGIGRERGDGARQLTTADKVAVAERLRRNPQLLKLAAICGRYLRTALAIQQAKVEHQPSEITAVTRGDDLAHLLPNELALLTDPALEDLFYYRYAEKLLGQYEVTGKDKLGRGPIIVATDESGSMKGGLGVGLTRDLWAKALALALLAIARKQKRDFAWLHFGSYNELAIDHFPKGAATPVQVIAAAEHFFNGGTAYKPWMDTALRLVQASQYQRADVILLSDGLASITELREQWNRTRRQRGMRAYAVLLASADTRGADVLTEITDHLFTVHDLTDEGAVLNTVFAV